MFSSLTCIIGNAGQSAYSAANTFMTGLVEQRRKRGLPASVLHIAMVIGLGYVHRARDEIEAGLRHKVMTLAESDLHQMLAEAIYCGKPRSKMSGELITGLKTGITSFWKDNPRLWHFYGEGGTLETKNTGQVTGGRQKTESVETLLAASEDENTAVAVLEDCFVHVLGNILQVEPDKLDRGLPVYRLGIDSLVAVQIRAWFLKEVGVEISVLEVLGDNSLSQLCKNPLAGRRRQQDQKSSHSDSHRAEAVKEDMDWDCELAMLATEVPKLIADIPQLQGGLHDLGGCIVLTGSTGFLGRHVLRNLIADGRVKEVHCLAIRPDRKGRRRSLNTRRSKIHEHSGDLTEPRLGLSLEKFANLAERADAILHVGVDGNIAGSYSELRPANINSTQQLLAMASIRNVPLHYVSASAIAAFQNEDTELAEISASHLQPPRNIDDFVFMGLTATKWASEVCSSARA